MLILIGDCILLTNSEFQSRNAKITRFWTRVHNGLIPKSILLKKVFPHEHSAIMREYIFYFLWYLSFRSFIRKLFTFQGFGFCNFRVLFQKFKRISSSFLCRQLKDLIDFFPAKLPMVKKKLSYFLPGGLRRFF